MRVYLHELTVMVITTIESPDEIELKIDALGTSTCRIDARTHADNRMRGPSVVIADPPAPVNVDASQTEKRAWANAYDVWLDTMPNIDDFRESR